MAGATDAKQREGYLAALRFPALNHAFDPVVRLTMRERRFKRRLLEQAAIRPGQRVLDLGCGTGTLAILVKQATPAAEVVGLDGDPKILEQARAKAERASTDIRFDHGYSTELPYEDASFDRVLSTLFFHHLTTGDKRRTAREIKRVLRPGGELHVADFTNPGDPLMAAAFQVVRTFDGRERTAINAEGKLADLFAEAGLESVRAHGSLRTGLGRLALTSATCRAPAA